MLKVLEVYENMDIDLGLVLKLIREEKNLTQKAAAAKIGHGINQDILSNIENGRTKLQADIIPYVCKAYGCSPNKIFSYAYNKEQNFIKDSSRQDDVQELFNWLDEEYWQKVLAITRTPNFKMTIDEVLMIVLCYPEIKYNLHKVILNLFEGAYLGNKILDKEMADMVICHKQEFIEACDNLLKNNF